MLLALNSFSSSCPVSSFRIPEPQACCVCSSTKKVQVFAAPRVVQVEGNERQTWVLACAHWSQCFPCFQSVFLPPLYISFPFLITGAADPQQLQAPTGCRGNNLPSTLPSPSYARSNLYNRAALLLNQTLDDTSIFLRIQCLWQCDCPRDHLFMVFG